MNWRLVTRLVCIPALFLAMAAASSSTADHQVRRGNEAFERGQYQKALGHFGIAEERITDPGLASFNKATALYQLGRYREAELHFRRCQEDAVGRRRAHLLFNLANCLLQQPGNRDIRKLKEAISLYEGCLQDESADASQSQNARHNLELTRLLLAKARSARKESDSTDDDQTHESRKPEEATNDPGDQGKEGRQANPDPRGRQETVRGQPEDGNAKTGDSDPPPPGKGNLPALPDDDELAPLTPEDAAEHLRQAATRIARDLREHRTRLLPAAPAHVKDW